MYGLLWEDCDVEWVVSVGHWPSKAIIPGFAKAIGKTMVVQGSLTQAGDSEYLYGATAQTIGTVKGKELETKIIICFLLSDSTHSVFHLHFLIYSQDFQGIITGKPRDRNQCEEYSRSDISYTKIQDLTFLHLSPIMQ